MGFGSGPLATVTKPPVFPRESMGFRRHSPCRGDGSRNRMLAMRKALW